MTSLRSLRACALALSLVGTVAVADATDEKAKVATAPAAADASPTVTAEAPEKYGKTEGIAGPVVFGPKLTAVGFPTPFRGGLEGKWDNLVGLSFDYGIFPKMTFSNVSIKANGWMVNGRIYPWRRAFYLGLGLGRQTVTGAKTEVIGGQPTTATLDINSTFLAPNLGWRWVWNSGFFLGVEVGAQIPISTGSVLTDNASAAAKSTTQYQNLVTQVNDKANDLGDAPLPQFALIQVGYFF